VTCLVGAGAVAVTAAWALRVHEAPASPEVTFRSASAVTDEAEQADPFDPAAFDVALWHVPPAPEPVVEPTPERPPPPPRLTLVAIIREPAEDGRDALRAALHDPDQDKLLTVAAGEAAGAWKVMRVTNEGVELSDGQRTSWLALRPDEKGSGR
jgi:hypothetical protein